MDTKKLMEEIVECSKSKYSTAGMSTGSQKDGCISSAVSIALRDLTATIALNDESGIKVFVLALIESQRH